MKSYELTYIANPKLSPEDVSALQERIFGFITKEDGTPGKASAPSKKRLAYPVKKHEEAHFSSLELSVEEGKLKSLEEAIKKEKDILRYLIIKKPAVKKMVFETKTEKRRSLRPKKAQLEEIDKKIDEML